MFSAPQLLNSFFFINYKLLTFIHCHWLYMTFTDNIIQYSQDTLTESRRFVLRCIALHHVEVCMITKFRVYPPQILQLQHWLPSILTVYFTYVCMDLVMYWFMFFMYVTVLQVDKGSSEETLKTKASLGSSFLYWNQFIYVSWLSSRALGYALPGQYRGFISFVRLNCLRPREQQPNEATIPSKVANYRLVFWTMPFLQ